MPAANKVVINTLKGKVFNKYLCTVSGKEDVLLAGENDKIAPSPLVIKNFKTNQTFSTRKVYFKRPSSDEFTQESQEGFFEKIFG